MKYKGQNMLRCITLTAGILLAITSGGCTETAKKAPAAKMMFEKNSAKVKLPVAQQQYASGKYEDATKTLNEVLAADKDCAPAHLLMGKILLIQGLRKQGADEVDKAIATDPSLYEGWFILGTTAEEGRDMPKARQMYDKAMAGEATNTMYVLAASRCLITEGAYEEAQKLLEEKMAAAPANADFKVEAARLMQSRGKLEEAISLYRQAKLLRGDDTSIAESLGYCYVLAGKWQNAADVFGPIVNACRDESKMTALIEMLAMCEMHTKQYSSAEKHYSTLTVAQRDSAKAWLRMGQAALGAGAAGRAYTCSQRALALETDYVEAIILQGCSEYLNKDYAAATKSFERVTGDKEHGGFAWLMIGKCQSSMGKPDKAKEAYDRARMYTDPMMADYLAKVQS